MTATEVEAAAAYKRGTSVEVTAQTARGPRTFRSTVEYMDLKSNVDHRSDRGTCAGSGHGHGN